MTSEAATRILIPNDEEKIKSFVKAKKEYAIENSGKFDMFEGLEETFKYLLSKNINIWVCTSAPKEFVEKVYKETPLLSLFEKKTVWREMYTNGKPDTEPILQTLNKMNLTNNEAIYIGDAYNDYLSATNAGCVFIYFCSDENNIDSRIPLGNPRIVLHKELITFLKI